MHAVKLVHRRARVEVTPPELAVRERGARLHAGDSRRHHGRCPAWCSRAIDGGIRAYSTKDGSILWEFIPNREFTTVNGVPAKGRVDQRPRPDGRGRHALHQLRLRRARRTSGECAARLRDRVAPRMMPTTRLLASLGAIAVATIVSLSGQERPSTPNASRDLEGIWNFATLTPFERPASLAGQEFFTDEQAAKFEADTTSGNDRDRRDGGAAVDAARGVGEYWFDRGTHVGTLDGRKRTSWVIDPPDGRVPPLTPEARAGRPRAGPTPANIPRTARKIDRCRSGVSRSTRGRPSRSGRTTTTCRFSRCAMR